VALGGGNDVSKWTGDTVQVGWKGEESSRQRCAVAHFLAMVLTV